MTSAPYCPSCGARRTSDARYCDGCGAPATEELPAAQSVADPEVVELARQTKADLRHAQVDIKGQLRQVVPLLVSHERLHAVFDLKGAGTGFIAITDKRLMFYDKDFMRKRKALTSVPFSKVTAVSAIDEGGIFRATSELVVKTGSEAYEFEFRGGDKAQRAYHLIMHELLQHE